MVDTDDTRRTTDDGRRTTDDGRRTTPRVWHKLQTGELKTNIEAYNEFLTNASHTNKRGLPLNCSFYIGRYQTPDL